jgi:hypothetical protein
MLHLEINVEQAPIAVFLGIGLRDPTIFDSHAPVKSRTR